MDNISVFFQKDRLTQDEIVFLRNHLKAEADFSNYGEIFIKHGILDNIGVDLLLKKANENQLKLISSKTLPIKYEMYPILVFLMVKNYPEHYRLIFEFIRDFDLNVKRNIVRDNLFTGKYLYFLCKLMKNDPQFVAELISASKIDDDTLKIIISSTEPEVLFRISNLKHLLIKNVNIIRGILNNPYTPDESVIALKQLLVDINEESIELEKDAVTENQDKKDEEEKPKTFIDKIDKEIEESLSQKISKMSTPEKIKLALKGNKSARMALIKDPNKQISTSVLDNPKITEDEISFIAKNKSTPEHIMREIVRNNTWINNYNILRDIMFNPKTPIDITMAQLGKMSVSDLEKLSKSKDIPSALKNQAQRMFIVKTVKK
ncbi:MAG: hypothetical protein LDL13_01030 [Calditerrivibrio sp.]|nr:hypothetical protein [Calditerrivibrio sp.]MCA1932144.1 hypothetical protein [Calditerrivibrio sp.]MCA1980795.1 hypothetical protein [Calditerrivibrio sp.]